jgi:hypothetical protein
VAPKPFEIDITRANNLIGQWANIAADIARQCKWRPQGKCLATCQGLAVCNLDGLELVDHGGAGVGGAGVSPALLKPDP